MEWLISMGLGALSGLVQYVFAYEYTLLQRLNWHMAVRGYFHDRELRILHWCTGVTLLAVAIGAAPHKALWAVLPAMWLVADYIGTKRSINYVVRTFQESFEREGVSKGDARLQADRLVNTALRGNRFPLP